MNTATINGHKKGVVGVNINPTFEEEFDTQKFEDSIILNDSTKEKILNKHRKRIEKKEIGNAELKARIEGKELQAKLEEAKVGSWNSALLEQRKQILKLMQYSFFSAIVFLFALPAILSFLHAYSIASMSERLGGKFLVSYLFGLVFSGLMESLMIGLCLQFAHRQSRMTMYSAMSVIGIVTSVEVFKKGIDVLQLVDVVRLIGSIFMIPVIHAFACKIRDKAEKGNNPNKKLLYERLNEETQKSIDKDLIFLQGELKKFHAVPTKTETKLNTNTGKTFQAIKRENVYKIDRFSFPEYSNAKHILRHSLEKKLVEFGVYTTLCWKQLKSHKNKATKTEKPVTKTHPENT